MNERTAGSVMSVNVGRPRDVDWYGRRVTTAIWKDPVAAPVRLDGVNLDGDDQADRRVHGGQRKAVYAYAHEDYVWWSEQLGRPLPPGSFGDNLTFQDVDVHTSAVGETWQIGTALLRVTEPRFPCFKLGIRMADASFVERFATARRFGTYFAIVEPGSIAAGDEARRLDRPTDVLTIAEFIRANEEKDPELLGRVADHALVADAWREHARRALQRRTRTVPE